MKKLTALEKLPEVCYGVLGTTNQIIMLKRGEKGYYPSNWPAAASKEQADEWCDHLNEGLEVTKAQRQAMEIGSMFGFDVPGANPDLYEKLNK